jgi:aspartate/methionine/tyrosine aminotransferase
MIDGSRFGFATDVEVVHWLITEAGVTSVPPSAFYADASRAPLLARFCFAKQHATIAEAAARLQAAAPKLVQLVS